MKRNSIAYATYMSNENEIPKTATNEKQKKL